MRNEIKYDSRKNSGDVYYRKLPEKMSNKLLGFNVRMIHNSSSLNLEHIYFIETYQIYK
jgi:hypothetical protein